MAEEKIDELDLIPDLKGWKDQNEESFTIADWVLFHATPELMVGFSSIFWPEFIEVDGCVFLKDGYDQDNIDAWAESTKGDMVAVQKVVNHQHIYDLFQNDSVEKLNIQQVKYLSDLLVDMWSAKLKRDFPQLDIDVQVCDFDEEDVIATSVSFWTKA